MKNVKVNVRGVYWKTISIEDHMNHISVHIYTPGISETKNNYGFFSNSTNYNCVFFGIETEQTFNTHDGPLVSSYSVNIEDEDIYIYNKDILHRIENKVNRPTNKPTCTKDVGVGSRFELLDL